MIVSHIPIVRVRSNTDGEVYSSQHLSSVVYIVLSFQFRSLCGSADGSALRLHNTISMATLRSEIDRKCLSGATVCSTVTGGVQTAQM